MGAGKDEPEKRRAREDGQLYTRRQFLEYYRNGEQEWEQAERDPSYSKGKGKGVVGPVRGYVSHTKTGASPSYAASAAGYNPTVHSTPTFGGGGGAAAAPAAHPPSPTPAQTPEKRKDEVDGLFYEWKDFVAEYGEAEGARRWATATRMPPPPPGASAQTTAASYDPVAGPPPAAPNLGGGGGAPSSIHTTSYHPKPHLTTHHHGAAPANPNVQYKWFVELDPDDKNPTATTFPPDLTKWKPIQSSDASSLSMEYKKPTNTMPGARDVEMPLGFKDRKNYLVNFVHFTQKNPHTQKVRRLKCIPA